MEKKALTAMGVVAVLVVAGVGIAMLTQGGDNETTTLKQQGSDTLLELMTLMSESFEDAQDDVRVDVTGGGSGVGINSLIEGTIDVAQASRQMKASEITAAKNNGIEP